jgi:succinyl-diaminopimelate desuccinylase
MPLPPRGTLGAMSALADRLGRRTLELVDIGSESLHEAEIRARLEDLVPSPFAPVFQGDEAQLWARERREGAPLLVLAGHYDTVPAQDNVPGRIADGAVHGCGASDMKGGVAVALELVRALADEPEAAVLDVGLLLFGREELPPSENPLPALFERSRAVHEADLAILLEPTDSTVQAGCVGNLNARLVFHGRSGHSARPWLADNAIDHAVAGLARIAGYERREVVIDGLSFYEVLTITRLNAGIADNVVPDRAVAHLNFRYPPDRTPEEAEAVLRSLVPEGAELELAGNSPPARVVSDTPLVRRLREIGGFSVEPKQAWTNVADFTSRGLDAVNLGPGATRWAHARDEQVEIAALVRIYEALWCFVRDG